MHAETGLYVQFGCGLSAPPTWINFDASPTLRLQKIPLLGGILTRGGPRFPRQARYGDIVRGLPLLPQSCQAVYCSHVLEHLALIDLRTALRNTLSHLRPGGIFRFVLPDLEIMARNYVQSNDPRAAIKFIEDTFMGHSTRPRGLRALLRRYLGNSEHLWLWDYKSLALELKKAGFRQIRRARFGDCADPRFKEVEDAERWHGNLGMECVRPA